MRRRSNRLGRRFPTAVVAVALSTGLGLIGAPAASAATNPYTPTEVCGAGYRVIASMPVDATRKWGGVYLLYKTGGYNCVATIKWSFIGTATDTMAGLYQNSESPDGNHVDVGNYKYYAVAKGYTPGCVSYSGWISNGPEPSSTNVTAVANSGWGWCG